MPSCILCDYMLCIHCESHSLFIIPSLESSVCHSLYCSTGSYHKATLTLQRLKSFFFSPGGFWFLLSPFTSILLNKDVANKLSQTEREFASHAMVGLNIYVCVCVCERELPGGCSPCPKRLSWMQKSSKIVQSLVVSYWVVQSVQGWQCWQGCGSKRSHRHF